MLNAITDCGIRQASVAESSVALPPVGDRSVAMSSPVTDPTHWRDRAAHMRALAATTADVETRTIMLRLADDYDKLAERSVACPVVKRHRNLPARSLKPKSSPRFYLRRPTDGLHVPVVRGNR